MWICFLTSCCCFENCKLFRHSVLEGVTSVAVISARFGGVHSLPRVPRRPRLILGTVIELSLRALRLAWFPAEPSVLAPSSLCVLFRAAAVNAKAQGLNGAKDRRRTTAGWSSFPALSARSAVSAGEQQSRWPTRCTCLHGFPESSARRPPSAPLADGRGREGIRACDEVKVCPSSR